MNDTPNLALPLLAASQAQKHVTMNEAISILDATTQLIVKSRSISAPPEDPVDGSVYICAPNGAEEWAGLDHKILIYLNGYWKTIQPKNGWSAFVSDENLNVSFSFGTWNTNVISQSHNDSFASMLTVEFDHQITAGSINSTNFTIPDKTIVFAVTGRVTSSIMGPTSWDLGVSGASDRYANGINIEVGSTLVGLSGNPQTYYSDTPLLITANGPNFITGEVRLAIHYMNFTPPN